MQLEHPSAVRAGSRLAARGAVVLLLACSGARADPPPGFSNQTLLLGLEEPAAIAFLPDATMLVVERVGRVRSAQPPYTSLDAQPVVDLVSDTGGQGVTNLILDPDFETNGYLYLFYTSLAGQRHRISRWTFDAASGTAANEVVVWQDNVNRGILHFGGGMAFGPEGDLYFTTGENGAAGTSNADVSQDLRRSWGKLLRITLRHDGSADPAHPYYAVPLDNPFHDGIGPNYDLIYARGLRNPFRVSFDSLGRLFIADVGGNVAESAREELHLGRRAANFGWPICEGLVCQQLIENDPPVFDYGHEDAPGSATYRDASIIGGFVYEGESFPAPYRGAYFYADFAQNTIRYVTLADDEHADHVHVTGDYPFEPFDGGLDDPDVGDIVDLRMGPDGALYYVDIALPWNGSPNPDGASVRRIDYVGLDDLPPEVAAFAAPGAGSAPLAVAFGCTAVDPEGAELTFAWSFGDGATSTEEDPQHTYDSNGPYVARVAVSDGTHTVYSSPLSITVGAPPIPTISAPQDQATFRAGDVIAYEGSATDPDGTLTEANYSWRVNFHHETHIHPFFGPQCCVSLDEFTIASGGHTWHGQTSYEVVFSVTDADGLLGSVSSSIFPEKVDLTIRSEPAGLDVGFDELSVPTPFVRDTLIGFYHYLRAPLFQDSGGVDHVFVGWSDGGAAEHTIETPTHDETLTASYEPLVSCPAALALAQTPASGPQAAPADLLQTLYRVRDEVLSASTAGQRLRRAYYRHAPDVAALLLDDPTLLAQARTLLKLLSGGLSALVAGEGSSTAVSPEAIRELIQFLQQLQARAQSAGRSELAQAIDRERRRLDPGRLAGLSFDEALARVEAAPLPRRRPAGSPAR